MSPIAFSVASARFIVKWARNELAVAGLLPPSYIREVLLPLIRDTQETVNGIKIQLDILTSRINKP